MTLSPRRSAAREAVARLPPAPQASRLIPSGRSVALSVLLVLVAGLLYLGARETPVFAVHTIDVEGVRPSVAQRVEAALRPLEGKSLLKVRSDEVERLATALPSIASVSYDRAFPNTLRVRVVQEQPVAVVRRGIEAWLVSRRGRVIKRIAQRTHIALPRVWLRQPAAISPGVTLPSGAGADEVAMLDALEGAELAQRVGSVHNEAGQWIYVLRGGLQVRVGTRSDLALKLAIARRILQRTAVVGYLDVSVPERPVAEQQPQLSG